MSEEITGETATPPEVKYWDLAERLIDEEIDKTYQARKSRRKRREWFAVSNAGFCKRATILNRLNAKEEDHDVKMKRIFWIGNVIHQAIQDLLKKSGRLVAAEEFLAPYGSGDRSGAFDDILRDDDSNLVLYEFKTKGTGIFWKMVLKDKKPAKHNVYQAVTYYDMNTKYNLQKLKVVYFSKEDAAIRAFTVDVTPELLAEVRAWWDDVRGYYSRSELPAVLDPASPEGKSWCKSCTFSKHWCFSDPAAVEDNLIQLEGWTSEIPKFQISDKKQGAQTDVAQEQPSAIQDPELAGVPSTDQAAGPVKKRRGRPRKQSIGDQAVPVLLGTVDA